MSRLDRTLRILERTPWQVCGVAGFSALVGIGISGETAARDAPTCTVDGTRPSIVLASEHIERLRTCGYVVVDGAISRSTLGAAICETAALAEQGRFASTDQHSAHVRSDSILWLDGPTASVAGSGLHDSLHGLRGLAHQLAQGGSTWPGFVGQGRATLGVTRAGQLATYRSAMKPTDEEGAVAAAATGGARYRAHRDGIAAMGLQVRMTVHTTAQKDGRMVAARPDVRTRRLLAGARTARDFHARGHCCPLPDASCRQPARSAGQKRRSAAASKFGSAAPLRRCRADGRDWPHRRKRCGDRAGGGAACAVRQPDHAA